MTTMTLHHARIGAIARYGIGAEELPSSPATTGDIDDEIDALFLNPLLMIVSAVVCVTVFVAALAVVFF